MEINLRMSIGLAKSNHFSSYRLNHHCINRYGEGGLLYPGHPQDREGGAICNYTDNHRLPHITISISYNEIRLPMPGTNWDYVPITSGETRL